MPGSASRSRSRAGSRGVRAARTPYARPFTCPPPATTRRTNCCPSGCWPSRWPPSVRRGLAFAAENASSKSRARWSVVISVQESWRRGRRPPRSSARCRSRTVEPLPAGDDGRPRSPGRPPGPRTCARGAARDHQAEVVVVGRPDPLPLGARHEEFPEALADRVRRRRAVIPLHSAGRRWRMRTARRRLPPSRGSHRRRRRGGSCLRARGNLGEPLVGDAGDQPIHRGRAGERDDRGPVVLHQRLSGPPRRSPG